MCSGFEHGTSKHNEKFKLPAVMQVIYHGNRKSEISDAVKIQTYLNGSVAIKNISPQFIENVNIVLEKYQDNIYVMAMLTDIVSEFL